MGASSDSEDITIEGTVSRIYRNGGFLSLSIVFEATTKEFTTPTPVGTDLELMPYQAGLYLQTIRLKEIRQGWKGSHDGNESYTDYTLTVLTGPHIGRSYRWTRR